MGCLKKTWNTQIKNIKPKESSIKYNPKVNELTLVSELKFSFDIEEGVFKLDQNPLGEPNYSSLENISHNDDYSSLVFQTTYRNKSIEFKLSSDYYFDQIVYKTLVNFKSEHFNANTDEDKVEIITNNRNISKIYCYKYNGYELKDSLSIISENDKLFLIKQNPWSKNPISKIRLDKGKIICILKDDMHIYNLNVQYSIESLVSDIFLKI